MLLGNAQVVDPEELQSVVKVGKHPALLAVAAKYGSVRLIDNMMLESNSVRKRLSLPPLDIS